MSTLEQAQTRYKAGGRSLAARYGGKQLARRGVPADLVTLAGLGLTLAACAVWASQIYWPPAFWFGWLVAILGAWFDVIDGAVAKLSTRPQTGFGAILDPITDRAVEGGMFTALVWVLYRQHAGSWAMGGCVLALLAWGTVVYRAWKIRSQLQGRAA